MFTETYSTARGFLTLAQIQEANANKETRPFTEAWAMKHIPASFLPFMQQALVDGDIPSQMGTPHVETSFKEVSGVKTMYVVEKNPSTKWVLTIEKSDSPVLGVVITASKLYRGMTEVGLCICPIHPGLKQFTNTPLEGVRLTTFCDFVDPTKSPASPFVRIYGTYDIPKNNFNAKALLANLTSGMK